MNGFTPQKNVEPDKRNRAFSNAGVKFKNATGETETVASHLKNFPVVGMMQLDASYSIESSRIGASQL